MSKNIFSFKTGHHASDEYFKHVPIWCDTDLLKTFLHGLSVGAFVMFIASMSYAGQLTHQFKSPAFSGQGYSAHVLTIENQEFSRKKANREKKRSSRKTGSKR